MAMTEWWAGLTTLTQGFFAVALVFSCLFLWQLVAAVLGLAGHGADTDVDMQADAGADLHADADLGGADAHFDTDVPHGADLHVAPGDQIDAADMTIHTVDTVASFKLLSIRSIIAFGMLFAWAGALYLMDSVAVPQAMLYALAWGLAGMLVVSALFYLMRRMTETGNIRLATCVGQPGTVYMDIPADGAGKVRTLVSGTVSFVPARAAGGAALKSGTPITVRRLLDATTVEVEKTDK
jgi:membrane protein implicated in regulation of membrane protease activity